MTNGQRAPRRMSEADKEKLIEMRAVGLTYSSIAKHFGLSQSAVSWWCLKLAAEPPKPAKSWDRPRGPIVQRRGDHVVRRFTQEEDASLLSMEQQGLRVSEIARRLNRKPNAVAARLMCLARREERAGQ